MDSKEVGIWHQTPHRRVNEFDAIHIEQTGAPTQRTESLVLTYELAPQRRIAGGSAWIRRDQVLLVGQQEKQEKLDTM